MAYENEPKQENNTNERIHMMPSRLVIWEALTRPHPTIIDYSDRRRAQLLMAIALALSGLNLLSYFTIEVVKNANASHFSSFILILVTFGCWIVYGLGRTRFFRTGGALLVIIETLGSYCMVLAGSSDPLRTLNSMIPLGIILASIFLSVRGQLLLGAWNFLAISAIPFLGINMNMVNAYQFAGIFLSLSLLLSVATQFRGNLERVRFEEVQNANRELKDVQATLEQRVMERTQKLEYAQKEAEKARQDLEAQFYQINGQVRLSETMRGEQEINTLGSKVLQQLCRYLNAQVGSLFLREGDTLRWAVGYSCSDQGVSTEFKLGEGLQGQAAFDQEIVVLKDVPDGYLKLTSGLGETSPRQIMIVPFAYNRRVIGLVELGTLGEFTLEQTVFMERVAENIAIAFHTAQSRMRVDELLAQTQIQARELKAREEELRIITEHLEKHDNKV
jgi:putative methionine-R-sulfoxide reductase with GAF domain